MRNEYGIKEERNVVSKWGILADLMLQVFADEGDKGEGGDNPDTKKESEDNNDTNTGGAKPTPNFNYEDLISKARKEEKDKLYPKITALEKEKDDLIEKNNKSLLTIGELQTEIETLKKEAKSSNLSDSEEVANLKKALADKEDELAKVLETTEELSTVEERVRNEVVEEYEVKLYREQKLREVGDSVIPELVTGATREDIDNSLALSQQRFNEIVEKSISGVNIPPANTSVSKFNSKDFSLEDLAQLDPRSEEYKEMRKKLGLK